MLRKTAAEIEKDLQATRPTPKTKIPAVEIEYCLGGKTRKEVFTDKENLLWALSFQNPLCMNRIKAKYPFLEISGLGREVEVEIKELK